MTPPEIIYWSAAIPVVVLFVVWGIVGTVSLFNDYPPTIHAAGCAVLAIPIGIIIGFGLWFFG